MPTDHGRGFDDCNSSANANSTRPAPSRPSRPVRVLSPSVLDIPKQFQKDPSENEQRIETKLW